MTYPGFQAPPNSDLVIVGWLRLACARPATPWMAGVGAGTTLPAELPAAGFIRLDGVGGSPDLDVTGRNAATGLLSCWAAPSPGSSKAPWGQANTIAETLIQATYDLSLSTRLVATPGNYADARVLSVFAVSVPRRVNNDPSGYARYDVDLSVHWIGV